MALPAEKPEIQMPTAMERCRGTRNMLKISDRVEGASVAPEMPINARAMMSMSGVCAKAASREVRLKPAAPIMSSRRRPMRSPSVPIVIRKPATMKP